MDGSVVETKEDYQSAADKIDYTDEGFLRSFSDWAKEKAKNHVAEHGRDGIGLGFHKASLRAIESLEEGRNCFEKKDWEKIEAFNQSMIDHLTGLYNRRFFNEVFKKEVAQAHRARLPLSIMMIDLDYFKSINDRLDHGAGDQALQFIADFLRKYSRNSDIVCRWAGEEFVIILPNTFVAKRFEGKGEGGALFMANKMQERFERQFSKFLEDELEYEIDEDGDNAGTVTVVVGELIKKEGKKDEGESSESFFKRVDDTLARAKEKKLRNDTLVAPTIEAGKIAD